MQGEQSTRLTGPWPPQNPLPLPVWSPARPAVSFPSLGGYEELAGRAEAALQRLLLENNYDTVTNFRTLWQSYRACRSGASLATFFRRYRPQLRPRRHTCVGLGLELLKRLPTAPGSAFLVSCEESIGDIRDYMAMGAGREWIAPSVEKEHVMVAMHIRVEGRIGLMLCDPGYHVARVVTIMADRCYPHTG